MNDSTFRLDYHGCRSLLLDRLAEPAPSRIQLLSGPRQVGKTTLLLDLADRFGRRAIYVAADVPEATLPGFFERLFERAAEIGEATRPAVLLLDEIHMLPRWSERLKAEWDRAARIKAFVHVVATGSSALRMARGSRESLAGRFERVTFRHWSASALGAAFGIEPAAAAETLVSMGSYPGAFALRADVPRWAAYVRESIVEPAIGRDMLALAPIRRPALLRQVYAVSVSAPAEILSLQKIRGRLQDEGALHTVAGYLALLEEAYLVAALPKYSAREIRRRAAPPKLVTLNNALLAASDPTSIPEAGGERFGRWLENACLAHAWNAGQRVSYWREEPLEVDGILEGSWGAWALEVKAGPFAAADLRGLLEFVRRNRRFTPLVVCDQRHRPAAERAGVDSVDWRRFLYDGVPAPRP